MGGNTPADDGWTLILTYTPKDHVNFPTPGQIWITFLPTGEIDFTKTSKDDVATANSILAPSMAFLQQLTPLELDFWKFMNWIFVSIYWNILSDLGQSAPTTYLRTGLAASGYRLYDFETAMEHSIKNNIFLNDSLYTLYSDYMLTPILPIVNNRITSLVVADYIGVEILSDNNSFHPGETVFKRSYACTIRKWRPPLTALVSILVAAYAFIHGGYSLLLLVAGCIEKRKDKDGLTRGTG